MAEPFFPDIERIRYEGPETDEPARVSLVRRRPARARQAHARPPALRGLLLAHVLLAGRRHVRRRDLRPAVVRRRRSAGARRAQGRGRVRALRQARRAVLHLPRSRRRARGRDAGRDQRGARPHRSTGSPRTWQRTGVAAAVGHGQPVQPPPLRRRRGDQPRSRGVRLRRRAGEEGDGRHAAPGRRQLRPVGRARGLRHAAQHRPAPRARPARPLHAAWSSSTSTRSASPARC